MSRASDDDGPCTLYTARIDEKGREVGGFTIQFSSRKKAEADVRLVEELAKSMKSKVKRVTRIEPVRKAAAKG